MPMASPIWQRPPNRPSPDMSGDGLRERIARLRDEARRDFERAPDAAALEALWVRDLARKGRLAGLFAELAQADAGAKRELGRLLNEAKTDLTEAHAAAVAR